LEMMRARLILFLSGTLALSRAGTLPGADPARLPAFVGKYSVTCHDAESMKGGLNLAAVLPDDTAQHSEVWEKVIRRLRGRQMPPAGKPRPAEALYVAIAAQTARTTQRA